MSLCRGDDCSKSIGRRSDRKTLRPFVERQIGGRPKPRGPKEKLNMDQIAEKLDDDEELEDEEEAEKDEKIAEKLDEKKEEEVETTKRARSSSEGSQRSPKKAAVCLPSPPTPPLPLSRKFKPGDDCDSEDSIDAGFHSDEDEEAPAEKGSSPPPAAPRRTRKSKPLSDSEEEEDDNMEQIAEKLEEHQHSVIECQLCKDTWHTCRSCQRKCCNCNLCGVGEMGAIQHKPGDPRCTVGYQNGASDENLVSASPPPPSRPPATVEMTPVVRIHKLMMIMIMIITFLLLETNTFIFRRLILLQR